MRKEFYHSLFNTNAHTEQIFKSPTIVLIMNRNDLDTQLFGNFV